MRQPLKMIWKLPQLLECDFNLYFPEVIHHTYVKTISYQGLYQFILGCSLWYTKSYMA